MTFLDSLKSFSGLALEDPYVHTHRGVVSYSGEFRRIKALQRRVWEQYPMPEIREALHHELRRGDEMSLFDIQVAALYDICLKRGAFLPIGVGEGKALISLLASNVLEAQRPLLLVPAQLREATLDHVIPDMAPHWKLPTNLTIRAYSELSLAKNDKMLEELRPDLIILDECHRTANKKAGRTRRLTRYFKAYPETMCVAESGTIVNRSIRDFAHIISWCLKGKSPVPTQWRELCEWADAIDVKVPDDQRVGVGALKRFGGDSARDSFRRRLVETPGVVASKESALGVSLVIRRVSMDPPASLKITMDKCRHMWERPDGVFFQEATELWRLQRSLALGLWSRWEPAAPDDWLIARNAWSRYVNETLKHNRRNLDTPLQVWNEQKQIHKDHLPVPGHCVWCDWLLKKKRFTPNPVPQWESDHALKWCTSWLKNNAPGIVWVEQVAFGKKLSKVSGFPYYGAGDDHILRDTGAAIIASIAAHGEGKNLQRFCHNLVTSVPGSGKILEQLLGRTHRHGQQADEVTCEVVLDIPEQWASWEQALKDARYLEDTFGNRQKLNYATLIGVWNASATNGQVRSMQ